MCATQNRKIEIFPDSAAIARRASELFIAAAKSAIAERGAFNVALSGGSTPKALNNLLAAEPLRSQISWANLKIFFGDERHAGPTDPDSNYRMTTETLLSKAPLKPAQVHRIMGEYPEAEKAALEYEDVLRKNFNLAQGQLPRFDLMFLGMGDEGHTLSLFPGTKALHDGGRLVMHNWVGKLYTDRITCTAPVANNSAMVVFMIGGAAKAPALKAVLEGPHEPEQLPSQLIAPTNGELFFLLDTAASAMLSKDIAK
ncbi:MAG TPA: 6-phosphogluconolactonase [Candidatus Dormibacteraeota bacterium]|nr:6-phosphogluconolactonase [Candidatus Dormibacteraeota bacterium]